MKPESLCIVRDRVREQVTRPGEVAAGDGMFPAIALQRDRWLVVPADGNYMILWLTCTFDEKQWWWEESNDDAVSPVFAEWEQALTWYLLKVGGSGG